MKAKHGFGAAHASADLMVDVMVDSALSRPANLSATHHVFSDSSDVSSTAYPKLRPALSAVLDTTTLLGPTDQPR